MKKPFSEELRVWLGFGSAEERGFWSTILWLRWLWNNQASEVANRIFVRCFWFASSLTRSLLLEVFSVPPLREQSIPVCGLTGREIDASVSPRRRLYFDFPGLPQSQVTEAEILPRPGLSLTYPRVDIGERNQPPPAN